MPSETDRLIRALSELTSALKGIRSTGDKLTNAINDAHKTMKAAQDPVFNPYLEGLQKHPGEEAHLEDLLEKSKYIGKEEPRAGE